jgi:peptidoglycan/LPS O-acetylase OafA/YrhL
MTHPRDESPNLDLLRSIAVLLVFINHVLLFLQLTHDGSFFRPIGHWGVLLFFVHTSLVLLLSLQRQTSAHYAHPYWVFLVRRCFRIYPLSVVTIAFVALLHLPLGHFEYGQFLPARFDASTIASDLLLVQNLTRKESILEVLWSLPYEMEMYLVLPAFFVLAGMSRLLKGRAAQTASVLAIWAFSAVVARALHARTGLFDYVPCFVAGFVAYHFWSGPRKLPAWAWPLSLAFATTVYLMAPRPSVGWLCCLFVGWSSSRFQELQLGALRKACQLIARYSYGVYLTHGICIWLALDELGTWPAGMRWALLLGTATLAPVVLYHAVEAPMIDLGTRLVRRFAQRSPATEVVGPVLDVGGQVSPERWLFSVSQPDSRRSLTEAARRVQPMHSDKS